MPDPMIDADLLAILACPSDDHAPLRLSGETLVCTHCASVFPIRDGIPVLLIDDATPGPNGIGHAAASEAPASETAAADSAAP
ncbi:MAG: hypothetical protein JWN61_3204 [Pseudonocardiales bacterium]|nr:hypothetical protein [Pseudonocardiales bacterium]